VSFMR